MQNNYRQFDVKHLNCIAAGRAARCCTDGVAPILFLLPRTTGLLQMGIGAQPVVLCYHAMMSANDQPLQQPAQSGSAHIFFCHGARDARWREPFDAIVSDFEQHCPSAPVALAFLEFMKPSLDEVIDRFAADGFTSIRILTLFLAAGGHTRRDLTAIVEGAAERWPACQFDVSPTLTESAEIRHAIVRWAAQEAVPGGVAAGD